MKVSKTEWLEVQNNVLFDTFIEISKYFDHNGDPIVTLKKSDGYFVRLAEGRIWWGLNLDKFVVLHSGRWSEYLSMKLGYFV